MSRLKEEGGPGLELRGDVTLHAASAAAPPYRTLSSKAEEESRARSDIDIDTDNETAPLPPPLLPLYNPRTTSHVAGSSTRRLLWATSRGFAFGEGAGLRSRRESGEGPKEDILGVATNDTRKRILRSVEFWVRNCVNPASSLSLAAGVFSRNSLPIKLHISVFAWIHFFVMFSTCVATVFYAVFHDYYMQNA